MFSRKKKSSAVAVDPPPAANKNGEAKNGVVDPGKLKSSGDSSATLTSSSRNVSSGNFRKHLDASLASDPISSREPVQAHTMSTEKESASLTANGKLSMGRRTSR